MGNEKTCRTCGYVGPVEDFASNCNQCKECAAQYNKDYRAKKEAKYDPDEIRICTVCGYEGPAIDFLRTKCKCKKCQREYNARHTAKKKAQYDPDEIKTCSICGDTALASEFYLQQSFCKKCKKAKDTDYRNANFEVIKKRLDTWVEEHKERSNEIKYGWSKKHPDKVKASVRKHAKAYPEKKAQHCRNRRAKKAGIPGYHTPQDIEDIFEKQKGRCVYCGEDLTRYYEIDHIISIFTEGSSNWPENLQLLCRFCNRSKGTKTHEEYLAYRIKRGLFIYKEAA